MSVSLASTLDASSPLIDWPDTDPPVPLPTRLIPLATFLRDRDYPPDDITGIIASVGRNGSVQCAERRLRAADLDGAEATLEGNAWAWGAGTDSERWELNPGC